MTSSFQVVGHQVPRYDGIEKVTGEAEYAADLKVPNMLWGRSLHSPYAHARIVSIDTSAAKALPGVIAVLTGEDVRGHLFGRALKDIPILADGVVRYIGDRVAAVAAEDEDIAQQAVDLIDVEYEELPAVFDVREAMKDDAPVLHPDYNSYEGVRKPLDKPSNLYNYSTFDKGNVDEGFAEADVIVENDFYLQRQAHAYMEPQAVVSWAEPEAEGRIHFWACNKMPFTLKEAMAYTLDVEPDRIVVHHMYIGGDFGGKSAPASMPISYVLSKATGRPVKMVNDYIEEFGAGQPRHEMLYHLKTGVKKDGTITAHQVELIVNCGAYAGYKPGGVMGGANQAAGPYRIENVRLSSANVYTNTLAGQIMRGPGEPQAVFAVEGQMDDCARAVGMDPVDFRRKNLVNAGEELAAGEALEENHVKDCLEAAVQAAGYFSPKEQWVGRGVAVADRASGGGQATCGVTMNADGKVTVSAAIFDVGTNTYTTYKQVLSEELGIPYESIDTGFWDTDVIPFDGGVAGSRQSRVSSVVAYEAAQEIKKTLIGIAAKHFNCSEDVISFRNGEIWRTDIEERISWQDLLSQANESVDVKTHINEGTRPPITAFCAQVAEVKIDPDTGQVHLTNFVSAHDVGTILQPVEHQGQINGGVMQGIGFALMEEMIVEDGRVTNLSFGDYKIPTIRDIPPMKTVLVPATEGYGPYNVKGIGELPHVPVAAAIANAVADALGTRIGDLPITPEKVYKVLKAKQS